MGDQDFVRVESFDTEPEAQIAQTLLREHGINSNIDNGDSAFGMDLDNFDGIDLIVMRKDIEKSKALIAELKAQEADQETAPAWTCGCGEEVDEGFFVCWSCGADYKPA